MIRLFNKASSNFDPMHVLDKPAEKKIIAKPKMFIGQSVRTLGGGQPSKASLIVIALISGIFGGYFIYQSFAATSTAGSFSIAAVGDMNPGPYADPNSASGKNAAAIRAGLANGSLDSFIGLGDYQYDKSPTGANLISTCSTYVNYWGHADMWKDVIPKTYPIAGPYHDWSATEQDEYKKFWNGECAGSAAKSAANAAKGRIGPGDFYSFDKGNWHFAALSTGLWQFDTTKANQVTVQLDQDLAAAKAAGKHLAVIYHDPYFTSTTSGHDREYKVKPWVDVIDKHDVRLTLSGSQHNYERSCPVLSNDTCTADDGTGTTAFQVSTGGVALRSFTNAQPSFITKRFSDTQGWLKLTLNEDGSFSWIFNPVQGTSTDSGSRVKQGGSATDSVDPTPSVLTATPGDGQASLSWTEATDNVGVTKYEVWKNPTEYVTTLSSTAARTYTITGLTNSTTYNVRVVAYDAAGRFANSNIVAVTPSGTGNTNPTTGVTGTSYYVDCNAADDTKDGKSPTTAWKNVSKANAASLAAGDGILFKRGCAWPVSAPWGGSLAVRWSGVTIGNYGSGELPKIVTTNNFGEVVTVKGSNNTIDGLRLEGPNGRGNINLYGINISGSKNNTIKNSYVTGMSRGISIDAGASYNKIGPNNIIYKNQMLADKGGSNDDNGAFGVAIHGNNNEIFQNYFEGQNVYSPDYVLDGAAIEFYTSCGAPPASNNKIYRNVSVNDNTFSEQGRDVGSTCTTVPTNNVYAYNKYIANSISNAIFLNIRGGEGSGGFGGFTYSKAYNNTAYITGSDKSPVICSSNCDSSSFIYRNNLIVAPQNISIGASVASNNHIFIPGSSDSRYNVDPKFVSLSGHDFHLQAGSPAIDKGSSESITAGFNKDLDNVTTPIGSAVDIGAYEHGSSTTPTDTTNPTVSIKFPPADSPVSGILTTEALAYDPPSTTNGSGITKVDFYVDNTAATGTPRMSVQTTSPASYKYSLNTATLPNGYHNITAKAYDNAGNSSTANVRINVINSDSENPSAPTNLVAKAVSSSRIDLSWSASTDNAGVAKYNVLRKGPNDSSYSVIDIVNAPATTYANTGLTASTSYSYYVQAVDSANNVSANSNIVSETTSAPSGIKLLIADDGYVNATATGGKTKRLLITDEYGNVLWKYENPLAFVSAERAGNASAAPLGVRWLGDNKILATFGTGEIGVIDATPSNTAANRFSCIFSGFNNDYFRSPYEAEILPDGKLAVALRYGTTSDQQSQIAVFDFNPLTCSGNGQKVWKHYIPHAHSVKYRPADANNSLPRLLIGGFGSYATSTASAVAGVKEVTYNNSNYSDQRVVWSAVSEYTHDAVVAQDGNILLTNGYYMSKIPPTGNIGTSQIWKKCVKDESKRIALNPSGGFIMTVNQESRTDQCTAGFANQLGKVEFRDNQGNLLRSFSNLIDPNPTSDHWAYKRLDYAYGLQVITDQPVPDAAAPSIPANLNASASTTAAQINLSWNASTDTGGSGLAGYNIYRGTSSGSITTKVNTSLVTGTSLGDSTGLNPNTQYFYQVEAVDGAGNTSARSNTSSAVTPFIDTTKPTAPNLTVTPGDGQATLNWAAASDNVGVTRYEIWHDATYVREVTATTAATYLYTVTGLTNNISYNFRVVAYDAANNYMNSNIVSATPAAPADTTNPTVSIKFPPADSPVSGILTTEALAYDPPSTTNGSGITKVDFYLDDVSASGTPNMSVNTTSPASYKYSLNTATLSNGSHDITAKAYDTSGNSSLATVTVNVSNSDTTAPNAPTNLAAKAVSSSRIDLSWDAPTGSNTVDGGVASDSDVVKYNVLRKGPNDSSYSVIDIVNAPATTYANTGLTASTSYSYYVQAVDSANNVSANSNMASATTPAAPDTTAPTAPSNLNASAVSSTQINLVWNASADTGGSGLAGYNIYRGKTGTGPPAKINSSLVTTTSFGDTGLTPDTGYYYEIEAVDAAGNTSARSNIGSATTFAIVNPDPVVEAETMTLPSGTFIVSDTSASGSSAIRMYTNGAISNQVTLNSPMTKITIRAKSAICNGAPQMTLRINGAQVRSISVSTTGWTDYAVPVNLADSSYSLSLSFDNDYSLYAGNSGNIKCSRDLDIDKITFSRD